jgi:hypothetical protein
VLKHLHVRHTHVPHLFCLEYSLFVAQSDLFYNVVVGPENRVRKYSRMVSGSPLPLMITPRGTKVSRRDSSLGFAPVSDVVINA